MAKRALWVLSLFLLLWVAPVQALDVLFIGNSYTRYSVSRIEEYRRASPRPNDYFVYEVVEGYSLAAHLNRAQTLHAIRSRKWDYVVLQDHSLQTIRFGQSFVEAMRAFNTIIRETGAQPVLFMTWARIQTNNYVNDQRTVANAYQSMATELNAPLLRVGEVWLDMYSNRRTTFDKMFIDDGIHPTIFGTTAVAASVMRAFHGGSLSWAPTSGTGTAGLDIIRSAVRINQVFSIPPQLGTPPPPPVSMMAIHLLLLGD